MLDALANNEFLCATVYTFHDKATYGSALQHTFGEWSHTPSNTGGTTGTTEFRDSAGDIKNFMKGWVRAANAPEQRTALRGTVPTAQELGYLEITNVDTSLDLPRVAIYSVEDIDLTSFFYISLASASSPSSTCLSDATSRIARARLPSPRRTTVNADYRRPCSFAKDLGMKRQNV